MTQNQSGCLVPTTLRGAGGGSDAVKLRCDEPVEADGDAEPGDRVKADRQQLRLGWLVPAE